MPDDILKYLDEYQRLKEEIKQLYKLKIEYEGNIYWSQNDSLLQEARDKLSITKELIAKNEVRLGVLEGLMPPPTIPSAVDDWLLNPDAPSEKFDREKWLERQKKAREKARKLGRSFEPE